MSTLDIAVLCFLFGMLWGAWLLKTVLLKGLKRSESLRDVLVAGLFLKAASADEVQRWKRGEFLHDTTAKITNSTNWD
jgi:hypothetical protein